MFTYMYVAVKLVNNVIWQRKCSQRAKLKYNEKRYAMQICIFNNSMYVYVSIVSVFKKKEINNATVQLSIC